MLDLPLTPLSNNPIPISLHILLSLETAPSLSAPGEWILLPQLPRSTAAKLPAPFLIPFQVGAVRISISSEVNHRCRLTHYHYGLWRAVSLGDLDIYSHSKEWGLCGSVLLVVSLFTPFCARDFLQDQRNLQP